MTVFADSSALYAVVDRTDADHHQAAVTWHRLVAEGVVLMTSNYVLVETSALLQRRLGVEALRDFQEQVAPLLRVVWVGEAVHASAVGAVLAASRRKLSLVDCVSFEVMRESGVRAVFCFDEHFREQGFEVMP
jgi:predicted nucleic acid-binding protein